VAIILILVILYLSILILPFFKIALSVVVTLLLPTVFAWVFYYIFRPLRQYLEYRGVPRIGAIGIIFVILAMILTFLIIFLWPFVSQQISEFAATPREKIEEVENRTISLLSRFNFTAMSQQDIKDYMYYYMGEFINFVTKNFATMISSLAQIATYIVVTPFILFYLLRDDHLMALELHKATPEKHKERVRKLINDVDTTMSTYIIGQVVVAFFVGFLVFIGYWLIGLPYALLLACIAFVFNLIPFCGPIFATIPAFFIGLSQSSVQAFNVILVVIVVHLLDVNLISPKIVGERLNIYPITIILLLVASFSLFGLLGVFLITPAYALLRTVMWDMYEMKSAPILEEEQ
jgi:predicted PurR-regulated permease PerM